MWPNVAFTGPPATSSDFFEKIGILFNIDKSSAYLILVQQAGKEKVD